MSDEQLHGDDAVVDTSLEPDQVPPPQRAPEVADEEPPVANRVLNEILTSSWLISLLAIVVALLVGSILIAATDPSVQKAAGYFFARPGDTFRSIWESVSGAYISLFEGAIYNPKRGDFVNAIKPLTETLTFATPLIAAGLGVAVVPTLIAGLLTRLEIEMRPFHPARLSDYGIITLPDTPLSRAAEDFVELFAREICALAPDTTPIEGRMPPG